jgi:hypothetical protein
MPRPVPVCLQLTPASLPPPPRVQEALQHHVGSLRSQLDEALHIISSLRSARVRMGWVIERPCLQAGRTVIVKCKM